MTERLLARRDVEEKTALRHSKIYDLINAGAFPRPVKIGGASRWRESEIDVWIAGLAPGLVPGQADVSAGSAAEPSV